MNKYPTLISRSCNVHSSRLPSYVPENIGTLDSSQQTDNLHQQEMIIDSQSDIDKTCHYHRNNHNNDIVQQDEVLKSISDPTYRKRRSSVPSYHRTEKKTSSLPMYFNHILLILIRLMILFLVVLIVSFTFYSTIVYFYSKPKKSEWKRMIDWLFQE